VRTSNPIQDRQHTVLRHSDQKKIYDTDKMENGKEWTQATGVHVHKEQEFCCEIREE